MKNIRILIVVFILSACKQGEERIGTSAESNNIYKSSVIENVESANAIVVNENRVILLMPSENEIDDIQSKYSEEDFIEVLADMTWYTDLASEQLDSLGIKNQYFDKDSIIIKQLDKSETILIKKELDGDMVLIHPHKKPVISNSVDFDKAKVIKYFE